MTIVAARLSQLTAHLSDSNDHVRLPGVYALPMGLVLEKVGVAKGR